MRGMIFDGDFSKRRLKWQQRCSYCSKDLEPGDLAYKSDVTTGWLHERCFMDRMVDYQLNMHASAVAGPLGGRRPIGLPPKRVE